MTDDAQPPGTVPAAVPGAPECGQCGRPGGASREVSGTSILYSWPYEGVERYVCRLGCLEPEDEP